MEYAHNLDTLVADLDSQSADPETRYAEQVGSLGETLKEIRFHARTRYWQFSPAYAAGFEWRLARWLNNRDLSPEDQRTLLRIVPELQFIDRDDMLTLYRVAFAQQIQSWLMDQTGLDFTHTPANLRKAIRDALRRTWLCPITDSMDISQFCHVNGIRTTKYCPQWHTLHRFGATDKIRSYLASAQVDRVVLLEDFVGSGRQVSPVLAFALQEAMPDRPLLFVPLVISEWGLSRLRRVADAEDRFEVRPTLVVPKSVHVGKQPRPDEAPFVPRIRAVIEATRRQVGPRPFGFGGIGTLVLSHTNTPNNTPPFVWRERAEWAPLFPRVSRSGS